MAWNQQNIKCDIKIGASKTWYVNQPKPAKPADYMQIIHCWMLIFWVLSDIIVYCITVDKGIHNLRVNSGRRIISRGCWDCYRSNHQMLLQVKNIFNIISHGTVLGRRDCPICCQLVLKIPTNHNIKLLTGFNIIQLTDLSAWIRDH